MITNIKLESHRAATNTWSTVHINQEWLVVLVSKHVANIPVMSPTVGIVIANTIPTKYSFVIEYKGGTGFTNFHVIYWT